ncbi:MAG: virulence protein E [Bacteroidales bacterium]|nr:virulence protein E [Bacteroidales bacterium]
MLAGTRITNPSEALQKVTVDYLYNSMRNPKPEVENRIRHLRIIRDMDKSAYAKCKKELPYFVCGVFSPAFRRTENFAYTEHFVIDIDHIAEKGLDMEALRNQLEGDARVLLLFASPGEDGLKVMFRLKERCSEPSIYSLFYKKFAQEMSLAHHLEQVIDAKTSDVCRACFISVDRRAYYNPDATPVDLNDYVKPDDAMQFFSEQRDMDEFMREMQEQMPAPTAEERQASVSDADMDKIRSILKVGRKKPEKPPVIISQQLTEIMDDLQRHIEATGVTVTEVININYGKKIRMSLGLKMAEVNVFYGKRGYSVVVSPRTGTNMELNEMMQQYIESFFFD